MSIAGDPPQRLLDMITLLDRTEAMPGATALRSRSYDLLELAPGSRVVDVGCGTGLAVAELDARGARAVGVDPSEHMLAVARSRRPDIELREASAEELPFGDGEFAGYRADKVFHVIPEPSAALREARRVLAPGGRIVLLGQDWDAFVIDSDEPILTDTIVRARAGTIAVPRAARGYRNMLLDAGFGEPAVEVHTEIFTGELMLPMLLNLAGVARSVGAITDDEAQRWTAEQTHRASADRMFLALPLFVATARR